jgi:hypothetical protein
LISFVFGAVIIAVTTNVVAGLQQIAKSPVAHLRGSIAEAKAELFVAHQRFLGHRRLVDARQR